MSPAPTITISDDPAGSPDGPGTSGPGGTAPSATSPATSSPAPSSSPSDGTTAPTADPGPDPAAEPTFPTATTDDFGRVGANGRAMLRGSVPAMIVEIDSQAGFEPDAAAVDHLLSTMSAVVDKPGGVQLSGGNSFTSSRTSWTSADLREAGRANRQHRSSGNTVVVYALYVDGGFVQDGEETSAIGVAHNASEMAIFPAKFRTGLFAATLGSASAVERAVLVHEAGHLFGLVNITYTSEIAHEDPEHPGHSGDTGSTMYWAIDSTAVGQIFTGPPPDDFAAADLADLDGLRTGKY